MDYLPKNYFNARNLLFLLFSKKFTYKLILKIWQSYFEKYIVADLTSAFIMVRNLGLRKLSVVLRPNGEKLLNPYIIMIRINKANNQLLIHVN